MEARTLRAEHTTRKTDAQVRVLGRAGPHLYTRLPRLERTDRRRRLPVDHRGTNHQPQALAALRRGPTMGWTLFGGCSAATRRAAAKRPPERVSGRSVRPPSTSRKARSLRYQDGRGPESFLREGPTSQEPTRRADRSVRSKAGWGPGGRIGTSRPLQTAGPDPCVPPRPWSVRWP